MFPWKRLHRVESKGWGCDESCATEAEKAKVVNFLAGIQAEVEVEENVDRKGNGTVVPNGANPTTSLLLLLPILPLLLLLPILPLLLLLPILPLLPPPQSISQPGKIRKPIRQRTGTSLPVR